MDLIWILYGVKINRAKSAIDKLVIPHQSKVDLHIWRKNMGYLNSLVFSTFNILVPPIYILFASNPFVFIMLVFFENLFWHHLGTQKNKKWRHILPSMSESVFELCDRKVSWHFFVLFDVCHCTHMVKGCYKP